MYIYIYIVFWEFAVFVTSNFIGLYPTKLATPIEP